MIGRGEGEQLAVSIQRAVTGMLPSEKRKRDCTMLLTCAQRFYLALNANSIRVPIIIFGVCASLLMYWISSWALGVTPDSIVYMQTAKNLVSGKGFYAYTEPMTHFPPVYPLLIAFASFFYTDDFLQVVRLLNAIFFGANIVLLGFAIKMCTENSWSAVGSIMLFFLSSVTIFTTHSMAWSEPPFITFMLATLILLSLYVLNPKTNLLLSVSLLMGLALTTRYIGIALLPTTALTILILVDLPLKQKIRDIFLAITIPSLPLALWIIRNLLVAQSAANRSFSIHIITFRSLISLFDLLHNFALPIFIPNWIRIPAFVLGISILLITILVLYGKRYIYQNKNSLIVILPTICLIFYLIYILCLIISVSFFDAHTPLDNRILLPAFLSIVILIYAAAWSLQRVYNQKIIWYIFLSFMMCVILLNVLLTRGRANYIYSNGSFYNSQYWKKSEAITFISNINIVKKIYSNGPDAIWFLSGKEGIFIPSKKSPYTLISNEDYDGQLRQMIKEVSSGEAILVYLNKITWRWYLPSIEEIKSRDNLPIYRKLEDGVIFGNPLKTE